MAISCAVYNLPVYAGASDFPVGESGLIGPIPDYDDLIFHGNNLVDQPVYFQPDEDQKPVIVCPGDDSSWQDQKILPSAPPPAEIQPAFFDGAGAPLLAPETKPPVFESPWGGSEQRDPSRLVEWAAGDPSPAAMDWRQAQPKFEDPAPGHCVDEQFWLTSSQQASLAPLNSSEPYGFRLENLLPPQRVLESYNSGSSSNSSSGSNIFLPCEQEHLLDEHLRIHGILTTFCEQQQQQQCGEEIRRIDNSELPNKTTGRKCRMARKRRTLPYQMPFPFSVTLEKSVEELIAEKNLQFLLQKQLKPSDVGSLGRIVLPKKEAESCLPYLSVREGITIVMEDLTMSYKWQMRYRFWPNNKSRMYLLENTGEFIRSHCLKEGDLLRLYKDHTTGKYAILGTKASSTEGEWRSPSSTRTVKSGKSSAKGNKRMLVKHCKVEKLSRSMKKASSGETEEDSSSSATSFDSYETNI